MCKREWYVSETKDSLSGLAAGGGLPYGYAGPCKRMRLFGRLLFLFSFGTGALERNVHPGIRTARGRASFPDASAYLLVPVKTDTRTFLNKRFTRVGIPFVVFLFLYAFLPAAWGEFSWAEAWTNVKQAGINFIPRESHLWFVYMMLGLYLVMPVISPWLAKVGKREERFFLGLWAFTLCFYWLRDILGPVFGECWWNPYPLFYYVSGFIGYVLLGHYIRTCLHWSRRKIRRVCVPVLIACYVFGMWQFYHRSFLVSTPQELEMHWQNDTIVAGLMS